MKKRKILFSFDITGNRRDEKKGMVTSLRAVGGPKVRYLGGSTKK